MLEVKDEWPIGSHQLLCANTKIDILEKSTGEELIKEELQPMRASEMGVRRHDRGRTWKKI